jgi:hypothetical protein
MSLQNVAVVSGCVTNDSGIYYADVRPCSLHQGHECTVILDTNAKSDRVSQYQPCLSGGRLAIRLAKALIVNVDALTEAHAGGARTPSGAVAKSTFHEQGAFGILVINVRSKNPYQYLQEQ